MNPPIILKKENGGTATSKPVHKAPSTHFIGCDKAAVLTNITKSPNIVNQKVDTKWCVARRDYEDGRNTARNGVATALVHRHNSPC